MSPTQYRNLTSADIAAGLRLCRIAGWNQLASDWELFLSLSPEACRAAVCDGQVVGTVTTVNYEDRFAWVGMVLVEPSVRGQGIGSRLLEEALNLLRDLPSIRLDATPQGRPVYQRLGFVDEYELSRMQIAPGAVLGEPRDESTNGLQSSPVRESDLDSVTEVDREVFGAGRRAILRWAWQQAPEYAWMVRRPSGIAGYCFGRHGFNFDQIGPVHAYEESIARHLVRACLSANKLARPMVIDPLHHSPGWLAWLQQTGFVHQRLFTRMYYGENRYPGNPGQLWSIFGPEFG